PTGYSLTINGTGGDDNLTLDLSTGDVVPVGGLFFNGVGQTAADALHIVGGNQGSVTYTYTDGVPGNGSIAMSAYGTVNYTVLEPITNSGTASDVELNLPAGSD